MKRLILLVTAVLVLGVIGCAQTPPAPTAPVDKPYLSSQEAIGIAKREAVANYAWTYSEGRARQLASRSGGYWNATYTGNGKWTVELGFREEPSGDIVAYRWTVFEGNLTAAYIGATRQIPPEGRYMD